MRIHRPVIVVDYVSSDEEDEDSEIEIENEIDTEAELRMFAKTLGVDTRVDTHLLWLVQEAYTSPLPRGWSVCDDGEGKIYFHHELTGETTWVHPMDKIYKEVLHVIRTLETEVIANPQQTPSMRCKMMEIVDDHLRHVQLQASAALEKWSGPHDTEDGNSQFYYDLQNGRSTWYDPKEECENEIYLQYNLLHQFVSQAMASEVKSPTPYPRSLPTSPSTSCSRLYKRRISLASSGFHTPSSQAPITPYRESTDEVDSSSSQSPKRGLALEQPCPELLSPTGSMLFARRTTIRSS